MLARSALRTATLAAAPAARLSAARSSSRSVTTLSKKIYTAHAQATGEGRNGKTFLIDEAGVGGLEIGLSMPKELGGSGKGNNPEQLFGLGYSACFLSALQLVARNAKEKLPTDTSVDAAVSHSKCGCPSAFVELISPLYTAFLRSPSAPHLEQKDSPLP
jgi:Ohr subfamily peroxiredoxin